MAGSEFATPPDSSADLWGGKDFALATRRQCYEALRGISEHTGERVHSPVAPGALGVPPALATASPGLLLICERKTVNGLKL